MLRGWEPAGAVPKPTANTAADVEEPWKVDGVGKLFMLNTGGGMSKSV